jgi:TatD DNase family protein
MTLIRRHWNSSYGGVIHCFTEGPAEAREALELGFYISFAGIVTFPKSTAIQEVARIVPADRLLVETDAPFLAPVPMRGKRNEPAFVVHTARKVAELRGAPPEEIAAITAANFEHLFLNMER